MSYGSSWSAMANDGKPYLMQGRVRRFGGSAA